jgi:hypothetical protein
MFFGISSPTIFSLILVSTDTAVRYQFDFIAETSPAEPPYRVGTPMTSSFLSPSLRIPYAKKEYPINHYRKCCKVNRIHTCQNHGGLISTSPGCRVAVYLSTLFIHGDIDSPFFPTRVWVCAENPLTLIDGRIYAVWEGGINHHFLVPVIWRKLENIIRI